MKRRTTRLALATGAALSLWAAPADTRAQYGSPGEGGFSMQRWEEDYGHLRDASGEPRGPFDAIKYIPLDRDGDAYLSFGGQARYRYDYFNNYSFGPGVNDENGFHLQRYLAHVDAQLHENARAFVQLNAAFVDDREGGPRYGDVDDFDLQQAFVDFRTSGDANSYSFVRVGRQELTYGAERYVSPDDWRNVRRTFDGVRGSLSVPNDTVEVFAVRPVEIEQQEFNEGDSSTTFAGVYNALALPTVLPGAGTKFESYLFYLSQREDSPPPTFGLDADTYTVGARLHARPGPFDFDVEGNYQFGNVDGSRLSAWSVAALAGYTFESTPLTPRVYAGFDAASGSADPDGRFNQLFPPTYNYLGHLYLFGRPNLVAAHAGVELHLTKSLTLSTAHYTFWRQNTDDALYNLAGGVVRADTGSDAAYVGNEFDVAVYWQIDKYWNAYLGYAHFFSGDFIEETGPSKDVDFLYAAVTFTF
jgi:hypothetical protein